MLQTRKTKQIKRNTVNGPSLIFPVLSHETITSFTSLPIPLSDSRKSISLMSWPPIILSIFFEEYNNMASDFFIVLMLGDSVGKTLKA